MARSIRIEELLQSVDSASNLVDRPHSVPRTTTTSSRGKNAPKSAPPTARPELMVKTPSTSLVRKPATTIPTVGHFSWEFDRKERLVFSAGGASRKRKSPIDGEGVSSLKRPMRLPKFSVNIFHPEPVNNYPIPSEGCVPRMVKHCESRVGVVQPAWAFGSRIGCPDGNL
jgi:hypothetical protein